MARGLGQHFEEVDNGHNETAETDRSEAVCQGSPKCAPRDTGRVRARVVIPRAVDACNSRVQGVLQPLREPEGSEGDESDHATDSGIATSATRARGVVLAGRPFHIHGHEGDGKPGGVGSSNDTAHEADQVDVTKVVSDIDRGTQHKGTERDASPPAPEAEHQNDCEDQEDDATNILLPVQHVYGDDEAPDDVQYAGDPDDLLGKGADAKDVAHAEDNGDKEAEEEEDEGIGVDCEDGSIVDTGAIVTAGRG